jgi:hypothetical protein
MALFLFTASNEDVVRSTGRRCDIPFDRIVEAVNLGFDRLRTE